MTLAQLHYLVSLADERHFGRAARRCCVSQPTLSMAIKRLEEELGVVLFERLTVGARLTEQGERIALRANKVLEHTRAIDQLVQEAALGSALLRVGLLASLAGGQMPQTLPYLRHSLNGALQLCLQEGDNAQLEAHLLGGNVDALVMSQAPSLPDVLSRTLYEEPLVVLLPKSHPGCVQSEVSVNQLLGEALALPTEQEGVDLALRTQVPNFGAQRICVGDAALVLHSASLEALSQMVARGEVLSIVPYSMAASTGLEAKGVTHRLLINGETRSPVVRPVVLAWRASFPGHALLDRLAEALQATAPKMVLMNTQESETGLLVENGYW